MAALDWNDYKELRQQTYKQGYGKEELKTLDPFPNKQTLMNTFQAIEDWFVAAYPALKLEIETVLGQSITNTLAQKLVRVWFLWKASRLLG